MIGNEEKECLCTKTNKYFLVIFLSCTSECLKWWVAILKKKVFLRELWIIRLGSRGLGGTLQRIMCGGERCTEFILHLGFHVEFDGTLASWRIAPYLDTMKGSYTVEENPGKVKECNSNLIRLIVGNFFTLT